ALVEAARGVGADAPLEAPVVQEPLEFVAHRLRALLGAAPLGVSRLAAVRADEDVPFVVRFGHGRFDGSGPFYNRPTSVRRTQPSRPLPSLTRSQSWSRSSSRTRSPAWIWKLVR